MTLETQIFRWKSRFYLDTTSYKAKSIFKHFCLWILVGNNEIAKWNNHAAVINNLPVLNTQPSLDYPTQIAELLFGSFQFEFMGKIWVIQFSETYGYRLIIESWVAICCSFVITV